MFLDLLNERQKASFMVLASRLTMADGEDSGDEEEALNALREEMHFTGAVETSRVLGDLDVTAFDTHKSRVVAALELLRLAYADEYVHEAEIALVRDICGEMGFPEEWLTTMGEWATRFNEIGGEELEGEMAEYREALVQHAHQMMDM